jgi:hypothetical protein
MLMPIDKINEARGARVVGTADNSVWSKEIGCLPAGELNNPLPCVIMC